MTDKKPSRTEESLRAAAVWKAFVEDMEPSVRILMSTGMRRSEAWVIISLEGIRAALANGDEDDRRAQIAILDSAVKDFYGN